MATQIYFPFNYSNGDNIVAVSDSVSFIEVWQVILQSTNDATITFKAVSDTDTTILSGDMFIAGGNGVDLNSGGSFSIPLFQLEPGENLVMTVTSSGTVNGMIYWAFN